MSDPDPAPKRLQGKVAIITGGAGGLGESTARLFWAHGAKVIIADIQDERGRAICASLDENAVYAHCDVTDEADVSAVVDVAVEKFGQLDIMYNNAGVMRLAATSILTIEKEDVERVLGVNLVGSILGTKHAARVMAPRRRGCVLYSGSATALLAYSGEHAYVASKRGILGLAQNVAAELGQYGIRVNCVSPYALPTGMSRGALPGGDDPEVFERFVSEAGNLRGALLKVEDVARAALFLASDEASYVSGLNLVVDGGFTVAKASTSMATGETQ